VPSLTSQPTGSGHRRRRELESRAAVLRRRALDVLGAGPDNAGDRAEELLALVDAIADMAATQKGDNRVTSVLAPLAADLQELALKLDDHDATARALRAAGVGEALHRLHNESSGALLIRRACEEVRLGCGLERVLLSRVEHGHCRPWRATEEDLREPWFANYVGSEIELRVLAHVVAERRPDVIDAAHDNHDMVRISNASSYVAAPIMPAGQVVGLFQADHGSDGRPCDETDRDVLHVFAEAFGHVYERAYLLDRLRQLHMRIRRALDVVNADLNHTLALWRTPADQAAVLKELTPRERDVVALLTRGLSNQAIADRLDVSMTTIKAHVRHILAKLDAASRAEVIARLHHLA
jgi:DNA-binding CsgD family transcriptional regulator